MKLMTYQHPAHGSDPISGLLQGDRILNAGRLLGNKRPLSMLDLLQHGSDYLSNLNDAASRFASEHTSSATLPRDIAVPIWESRQFPPLPDPPSIRDFYAFEQHVAIGYRRRGRDIPTAWYERPVFYFGHTGNLFGNDEDIVKPTETNELDFELELAAVIGRSGRDIPASDAWDYIAGLTVMNDWSARDIQRQEMSVGLGPAKAKDFATSFGPVMITLDEVRDRIDGETVTLQMCARINGEPVSNDSSASMYWGFPRLIEAAARYAELRPGDIIGSGTCGGGCIYELGSNIQPWLVSGDEVELEIERIGRLRTTIR
jgi:2-keto-4-pentenoate hydratase/2-oxohepta-3-ene-1,7-dioic acid hydratase in catechol pathway